MDIMEIILLAAGGIVFVLSFLIPMKKEVNSEETRGLAKEEIKTLVSEELEAVRGHVDDVVEEAVNYSIEKTERSLERLSNEKIMAVNEYSDTVLSEIHKNHEEVMFLYDMLNDKHINLKNTVSEINRTVKEAKETKKEAEEVVNTFQRLSPEAVVPLKAGSVNMPQQPVTLRQPVAQQSSVMPQQPVTLRQSVAQQSSVMPQQPVTPRQPVVQQQPSPVVQQKLGAPQITVTAAETSGGAQSVVTLQPPVMTQEFVKPLIPEEVQEPVVIQKPVIPIASISEQESVIPASPVVTQESVMPAAPVMRQEPSVITQEIAAVLPQTFVTPQVFAAAPAPVSVQMPVASGSFAGTVTGPESPLPPDAISFTQETDGQGRNYNDLILEMYQNGKSNVAIARELNLGVGEVKLVIDLYKNRSEK